MFVKSFPFVASLAALLLATTAQAAIVGVNINTAPGRQGASLDPTDTAGVVTQTNWNNFAGPTDFIDVGPLRTWTAGTLVDNSGASTAVTLNASTNNKGDGPDGLWGQGGAGASGDSKLFSGGLQIRGSTVKLNIGNINSLALSQPYSLFVYMSDGNNVSTTVDIGSASTTLLPTSYTGTYTDGTGGVAGDYVKFLNLTADSLTVTVNATNPYSDPHTSVAGFQIVPFVPAPVPEPASLGIVALGATALLSRRRNHRSA